MSLWAIVPVKPLRLGKSRLRRCSRRRKGKVIHNLLEHYFTSADAGSFKSSIPWLSVVTKKRWRLRGDYNVRTVREEGSPFLNKALRRATTFAQVYSPVGVLILPADLPLITAEDIQRCSTSLKSSGSGDCTRSAQ
jgi:2-phospho-L-lactate guanylyltransferase